MSARAVWISIGVTAVVAGGFVYLNRARQQPKRPGTSSSRVDARSRRDEEQGRKASRSVVKSPTSPPQSPSPENTAPPYPTSEKGFREYLHDLVLDAPTMEAAEKRLLAVAATVEVPDRACRIGWIGVELGQLYGKDSRNWAHAMDVYATYGEPKGRRALASAINIGSNGTNYDFREMARLQLTVFRTTDQPLLRASIVGNVCGMGAYRELATMVRESLRDWRFSTTGTIWTSPWMG